MSTNSPFIKMLLQVLDENPDSWGTVLNVSALELLEDSIAGMGSVDVTSTDATLDDSAGGPSEEGPSPVASARYMIIDIIGAPGSAKNVIVPEGSGPPARSKLYLMINSTTGGQTITVKTLSGSGIEIGAGLAILCYCDGTDVIGAAVDTANNAVLAATATNALALGGDAAAGFPRLAVAQTFTASQSTARVALAEDPPASNQVPVDYAESNTFYCLWSGNWTLMAPSNPVDGGQFSLCIEQDTGGPHTITFAANTFVHPGGNLPSLSTGVGDLDYLGFEYLANHPAGARWLVSILKDMA
jgi:hypothetical protein